jgi:hypothetical protein
VKARNAWALGLAAVALALASLRHRRRAHAACDRLPIMEGLALRGEWEGWWESEQADPSDEITSETPLRITGLFINPSQDGETVDGSFTLRAVQP